MNYFLPPDTYPNFIGTASLLVAAICLCITFMEKQRGHATKLFSIMLVTSIAFFSSHWTTYFAAIFIVATAVTELEFLQNLAAIISKDKNYFDFKKEVLSKEENLRRKLEEAVVEEIVSVVSPISPQKFKNTSINIAKLNEQGHGATMRLALDIEEKALNLVSQTHGEIERNVRITQNNKSVEFDGFISSKDNKNNKIFEVKWLRNPSQFTAYLAFTISRIKNACQIHEDITGHKPEVHLILVLNSELKADEKERISQSEKNNNIYISCITLDQLGYEIIG